MTPARVDLKALEALVQKDEHPVHQCALIGTSVRPLIAALRIAVEALRGARAYMADDQTASAKFLLNNALARIGEKVAL